ncbi:MAG TPA: hypothetical protein VGL38_07990 [bacterium]|jgi:hypothetical protein
MPKYDIVAIETYRVETTYQGIEAKSLEDAKDLVLLGTTGVEATHKLMNDVESELVEFDEIRENTQSVASKTKHLREDLLRSYHGPVTQPLDSPEKRAPYMNGDEFDVVVGLKLSEMMEGLCEDDDAAFRGKFIDKAFGEDVRLWASEMFPVGVRGDLENGTIYFRVVGEVLFRDKLDSQQESGGSNG